MQATALRARPDFADLPVGVPFPAAPRRPRWMHVAKRAIDVVLATALLTLTAPVVLLYTSIV